MKKIISVLLVLSLVFGIANVAFASNGSKNHIDFFVRFIEPVEFDQSVVLVEDIIDEELRDLWASFRYDDDLSKEVKDNILYARLLVAYGGLSWRLDDVDAYIIRKDGTREEIPTVSEVFPHWDFEQIENFKNALETEQEALATDLNSEIIMQNNRNVFFSCSFPTSPANPFSAPVARSWVTSGYSSVEVRSLNVLDILTAFTNTTTGRDLVVFYYVGVGDTVFIMVP